MAAQEFVLDVTKIREASRRHMDAGPVTTTYRGAKDRLIEVLNDVVATELVCYMRYSQHAIAASGIQRAQVAAEFEEHAHEELPARALGGRAGEPTRRPS